MNYIVAIQQVYISIDIEEECQIRLYSVNKGIKKRLQMTGQLKNREGMMHLQNGKEVVKIDHEALILDIVMLRKRSQKSKQEKKKVGYVIVHLHEYKQNTTIELTLQIKDCIIANSEIQLKFSYQQEFEEEEFIPIQKIENISDKQNTLQRQKSNGQFKVLAQKVIQLQQQINQQNQTIKQLEQKLEQSKFDHQSQINKTKRIEEMYRKEKQTFNETNQQLRQQLMEAKNQITQIIEALNERGEASILQVIEDLISK